MRALLLLWAAHILSVVVASTCTDIEALIEQPVCSNAASVEEKDLTTMMTLRRVITPTEVVDAIRVVEKTSSPNESKPMNTTVVTTQKVTVILPPNPTARQKRAVKNAIRHAACRSDENPKQCSVIDDSGRSCPVPETQTSCTSTSTSATCLPQKQNTQCAADAGGSGGGGGRRRRRLQTTEQSSRETFIVTTSWDTALDEGRNLTFPEQVTMESINDALEESGNSIQIIAVDATVRQVTLSFAVDVNQTADYFEDMKSAIQTSFDVTVTDFTIECPPDKVWVVDGCVEVAPPTASPTTTLSYISGLVVAEMRSSKNIAQEDRKALASVRKAKSNSAAWTSNNITNPLGADAETYDFTGSGAWDIVDKASDKKTARKELTRVLRGKRVALDHRFARRSFNGFNLNDTDVVMIDDNLDDPIVASRGDVTYCVDKCHMKFDNLILGVDVNETTETVTYSRGERACTVTPSMLSCDLLHLRFTMHFLGSAGFETADVPFLSGACQNEANYPLFCTAVDVQTVFGDDWGSHSMGVYFMPTGYAGNIHDTYTYSGDAPQCSVACAAASPPTQCLSQIETNAVSHDQAGSGYTFGGFAGPDFSMSAGTYTLEIDENHPIGISNANNLVVSGTLNDSGYYEGTITIDVSGAFDDVSYHCQNHPTTMKGNLVYSTTCEAVPIYAPNRYSQYASSGDSVRCLCV
jgi:hypothetical protein